MRWLRQGYLNLLMKENEATVLDCVNDAMCQAGIAQRLNEKMLKSTGRSVANHYRKMVNIYKSNYVY